MSQSAVIQLPTDSSERWLFDLVTTPLDGGVPVERVLPPGYAAYVRLFHPLSLSDDGVRCRPRTWRSVADELGFVFHPEVQWHLLCPRLESTVDGHSVTALAFLEERPGECDEQQLGRWPVEGTIGEPAQSRLFHVLADASARQDVYFYYGTAAAFLCGKGLLFRAALSEHEAVQRLADAEVSHPHRGDLHVPGPEFVWPQDRSWIVATDCDLVSTYIACDERLADALVSVLSSRRSG